MNTSMRLVLTIFGFIQRLLQPLTYAVRRWTGILLFSTLYGTKAFLLKNGVMWQ